MRILILALCAMVAACSSTHAQMPPTAYDPAFAKRVGADERGMRQYVLVILKTGPATTLSEAEREKLFEGHFATIDRLSAQGVLLSAGPLGPNDRHYRGIYIFAVDTVEKAQALVETDPSVKGGIFDYEMYPWYGSAALMELPAQHARLQPPSKE